MTSPINTDSDAPWQADRNTEVDGVPTDRRTRSPTGPTGSHS